MTVTSSKILNVETRGSQNVVCYQHTLSDGRIAGPRVAFRPVAEDPNDWLAVDAVSLEKSLNVVLPDPDEELIEQFKQLPRDKFKDALKLTDAEVDDIRGRK